LRLRAQPPGLRTKTVALPELVGHRAARGRKAPQDLELLGAEHTVGAQGEERAALARGEDPGRARVEAREEGRRPRGAGGREEGRGARTASELTGGVRVRVAGQDDAIGETHDGGAPGDPA